MLENLCDHVCDYGPDDDELRIVLKCETTGNRLGIEGLGEQSMESPKSCEGGSHF